MNHIKGKNMQGEGSRVAEEEWGEQYPTGDGNFFSLGRGFLFSSKMVTAESRYIPAQKTSQPPSHVAPQCLPH